MYEDEIKIDEDGIIADWDATDYAEILANVMSIYKYMTGVSLSEFEEDDIFEIIRAIEISEFSSSKHAKYVSNFLQMYA